MDELRGWKEIGAYFDVASRTAQRWEREYAMPVHRTGRTRGASVFALRAELDHWRLSPDGVRASSDSAESVVRAAEPQDGRQHRRRLPWARLGVAAGLLVAVAVVVVLIIRSHKADDLTAAGGHAIVEGYAATNSASVFVIEVTVPGTSPILFHVFDGAMATVATRNGVKPVSYTHLTLPTILLV